VTHPPVQAAAATTPTGSPARCAGASMKGESSGRCRRRGSARPVPGPVGSPRPAPRGVDCGAAGSPSRAERRGRSPPPRLFSDRHPGCVTRRARASACTRPTGTPAPRGSAPPCALDPSHDRPSPGGSRRHPRQDDSARPPLMAVRAPLRITPPVRTLHPHGTIRTHARTARRSGRRGASLLHVRQSGVGGLGNPRPATTASLQIGEPQETVTPTVHRCCEPGPGQPSVRARLAAHRDALRTLCGPPGRRSAVICPDVAGYTLKRNSTTSPSRIT
jgi:hypothetical protein